MSRRLRGYRPAFVAAAMLAAALSLVGCSAGTVTQTDTSVSGAAGAYGQVGDVLIQDLAIDAGPTEVIPAGAPAPLKGTLINEGFAADRLVSVSSPYGMTFTQEGAVVVPGNNAVRIVGAEPGPVGPPNLENRLSGTMRLTMQGATQVLRPGPTYPVTFTFERSGTITIPIIAVGSGPSAG